MYKSNLASSKSIICTSEEQNDQRSIENSCNWEAIQPEDSTETDQCVIEVNFGEMALVYLTATKVEQNQTAETRNIDHLATLDIGKIFADCEDDHNERGRDEGEETDSAYYKRKHDIELAEPEYLKEGQTQNHMFDSNHDIIR